jgi:hypothetical protein
MDLMLEPFTPLKIRQAVLEEVSGVLGDLMYGSEDLGVDQHKLPGVTCAENQVNNTSRGPSLQLTSPTEEKEIF